MRRRSILLGALCTVVLGPLPAEAAEWVRLGERKVNLLADFDTIPVGISNGFFSHIRLDVYGNDIFIGNLRVVFSNGGRADLPVRSLIRERGRTRSIALPGVVRAMRRVELSYARALRPGSARVVVWGRRVNSLR